MSPISRANVVMCPARCVVSALAVSAVLAWSSMLRPAYCIDLNFTTATVQVATGPSDGFSQFLTPTSTGTVNETLEHGSMKTRISSTPGGQTADWHIFASAQAATYLYNGGYQGGFASSSAITTTTAHLTPTVDTVSTPDEYDWSITFDIIGQLQGTSVSPGNFSTAVGFSLTQNGNPLGSYQEALDSDHGFTSTMPRQIVFHVNGMQDAPDTFIYQFSADADAVAYDDPNGNGGSATTTANFEDTFTLSISDVFDVTTGQPVPLDHFHLIDENGTDWAHFPVPEPTTLALAALGLMGMACSRRRRI